MTLGFSILVLALLSAVPPASAVILFESHPFAATKSEIVGSADVFNCSPGSTDALCRNNFRYLDLNWRVKYRFVKNRLTQVLLFTEHTKADRTSLLEELSKDFHLAALKRGSKVLDLVRLSARESKARFKQKVRRFEQQGLAEADLVYVFLEKAGLNRRARKAKNIREMMAKMSILTRELDIWVEENGEGRRMVLSFAMPRAAMRLSSRLNSTTGSPPKQSGEKIRTYTPPKPRNTRPRYMPTLESGPKGEGRP